MKEKDETMMERPETPETPEASPAPAPKPLVRPTPRRRSNRIWGIAAASAVVLAIVAFVVVRSLAGNGSAQQYVTSAVERGTLSVTVDSNGSVAARSSASVNPSVSGKVKGLAVKLGDKVYSGQRLFSLDNPDLDDSVARAYASYRQSVASVERAEITLLQAQQEYESLQSRPATASAGSLEDKIEVAEENVDAAELSLSAARASKNSAWSGYERASETADERRVTAPIAGSVTALSVQEGDRIGSGGTSNSSGAGGGAAIVISNLAALRAQVQVAEVDRPKVKVRQKATVTFDALPDLTITGKVTQIDPVGTSAQNVVTYGVTISFDVQDRRLSPGMTAAAAITTAVRPDVLLVPNAAVKTAQDGSNYVQVLASAKARPENRTVTVGLVNDTSTQILEGVKEGEQVVTQVVQPGAATTQQGSRSGMGGFRMLGGGGGGRPD